MDHAGESPVLQACLKAGCAVRGVLATATDCSYKPHNPQIRTVIVDVNRAIQVLKALRTKRAYC